MSWVGGAVVSAAPFFVWVMTQRLIRDCRPQIGDEIIKRLPTTMFHGKRRFTQHPVPPPPAAEEPEEATAQDNLATDEARSTVQHAVSSVPAQQAGEEGDSVQQPPAVEEANGYEEPEQATVPDTAAAEEANPAGGRQRSHSVANAGDDFASDEEDNEAVSATLISFDVEATESTDAPAGLWSAELRPSESSLRTETPHPMYLDTLLTRLPALMCCYVLNDSVVRIVMAPFEAVSLRLIARAFRLRQGLSCDGIQSLGLLSGLNWNLAANFFGAELMRLALLGEVWAAFTGLSMWFHMSEEEWKEVGDENAPGWLDGWW